MVKKLSFEHVMFPDRIRTSNKLIWEPYKERVHQMANETSIIMSEDVRNISHFTWYSDYISRLMRLRKRAPPGPYIDECAIFAILLALTPQIEEPDLTFRLNERGNPFNIDAPGFLCQMPVFEGSRDPPFMDYMEAKSPFLKVSEM